LIKDKNILKDAGKSCPDCPSSLHVGQERFKDGLYAVEYCKQCGFRFEKPLPK
tara:strand:+ start:31728 stop:31886 length:159 start_codon:yes stop_codon:yes gene_type:complete